MGNETFPKGIKASDIILYQEYCKNTKYPVPFNIWIVHKKDNDNNPESK